MMHLTFHRVAGLRGKVRLPGDKSLSHRAVIFGSLARGKTSIKNFLRADDCMRSVASCRSLGVHMTGHGTSMIIEGKGPSALKEPRDIINVGNSGTTIRLMAGVLSAQRFFSVLTGDESLRNRPMKRVAGPLRAMGARIWGRDGGDKAPLAIWGGELTGMLHELPVPSAQVKSALLLAGLHAQGTTTIREPIKSRDHSERMLSHFGVHLKEVGTTISLQGGQELRGSEVDIPGDISSASFLIVAALVTQRSELMIHDVPLNPGRTGFIDILRGMGARIEIVNMRARGPEPRGDIYVTSSSLHGVKIAGDIIPRAIDEIPALCTAAAMADGETVITGAAELRVKESDRIATMAEELGRFGVAVRETYDGLKISGGRKLRGARCTSHGDHRVAMALSVLGLAVPGKTIIEDTDCIETSFPGFSPLLKKIITA